MSGLLRSTYRVFVGNLPWTVSRHELQSYFSKFGHVADATVIFDNYIGLSKGYGFVTFSNNDAFNSACNKNNHILEGRVLTVQQANS